MGVAGLSASHLARAARLAQPMARSHSPRRANGAPRQKKAAKAARV